MIQTRIGRLLLTAAALLLAFVTPVLAEPEARIANLRALYEDGDCAKLKGALKSLEFIENADYKLLRLAALDAEIHANLLMDGVCGVRDPARARRILERLRDVTPRNARVAARLGTLLLRGQGGPPDGPQAGELFRRAAIISVFIDQAPTKLLADAAPLAEPSIAAWRTKSEAADDSRKVDEQAYWSGLPRAAIAKRGELFVAGHFLAHPVTGPWSVPAAVDAEIKSALALWNEGREGVMLVARSVARGEVLPPDAELARLLNERVLTVPLADATLAVRVIEVPPPEALRVIQSGPEGELVGLSGPPDPEFLQKAAEAAGGAPALKLADIILSIADYPDAAAAASYWALMSCAAETAWPPLVARAFYGLTEDDRASVEAFARQGRVEHGPRSCAAGRSASTE